MTPKLVQQFQISNLIITTYFKNALMCSLIVGSTIATLCMWNCLK